MKIKEVTMSGEGLGAAGSRFYKFATARMKGQEQAIERLARALDWANSPLRKRTKPICSALFIGGAGSGKTHLIKLLAEFLFGAPGAFTIIPCRMFFSADYTQHDIDQSDLTYRYESDRRGHFREYIDSMSELGGLENRLKSLRQNVAKYDKKSADARRVRVAIRRTELELKKVNARMMELNEIGQNVLRNLRSIVVFDRLEEADPVVQAYLATLCEYGRLQLLTDKGSRNVSFVNSFVIITSNNCIPHDFRVGGFSAPGIKMALERQSMSQESYIRGIKEVIANFDCKFVSRLDRVEIFKDYARDQLIGIVDFLLEELAQDLMKKDLNISLFVSDEVKAFIADEGSDHKELGVWLLKRKFEKYITHQLGAMLLAGDAKKGDAFSVELKEKSVVFVKRDVPRLPPPA